MNEPAAFYEEILYPLQNGVLRTLADCEAPFYLTGGTALHRHYFDVRYSDDLDLFVNQDPGFDRHLRLVLDCLRGDTGALTAEATTRGEHYARVLVRTPDAELKVDLVNDTAPRFGELASGKLFPRIDSLRNMLSNKITALPRLEAKDVADLWTISRNTPFHWSEVLHDAGEKEMGMFAGIPSDLLRSFPPHLFDSVQWRRRPDRDRFLADLIRIADDLLEVGPNSLAPPNPESRAD